MTVRSRYAIAARDAQLRRVSRLSRQVAYAGVAMAGVFGAVFATQLPGRSVHPTSTPPQPAPTVPAIVGSSAAPSDGGQGTGQPSDPATGTTQAPSTAPPVSQHVQPPPAPPAPTSAPPVVVSGGS